MSERDDGGPAFPRNPGQAGTDVGSETWLRDTGLVQDGMTLRDWFAGQVITGLTMGVMPGDDQEPFDDAARSAYRLADAMLAERAKDMPTGAAEYDPARLGEMERGQAPDPTGRSCA